jgi:hypothetical protein
MVALSSQCLFLFSRKGAKLNYFVSYLLNALAPIAMEILFWRFFSGEKDWEWKAGNSSFPQLRLG